MPAKTNAKNTHKTKNNKIKQKVMHQIKHVRNVNAVQRQSKEYLKTRIIEGIDVHSF